MNVVIWIVQGLLAVVFLASGVRKLSMSAEKVAETMDLFTTWPKGSAKLIGAAEVLAAIGLVLPAATKIAPVLTPLAATGLVVVMVGATVVHITRKEWNVIGVTVVLGALALFVAITRFGPYAL